MCNNYLFQLIKDIHSCKSIDAKLIDSFVAQNYKKNPIYDLALLNKKFNLQNHVKYYQSLDQIANDVDLKWLYGTIIVYEIKSSKCFKELSNYIAVKKIYCLLFCLYYESNFLDNYIIDYILEKKLLIESL